MSAGTAERGAALVPYAEESSPEAKRRRRWWRGFGKRPTPQHALRTGPDRTNLWLWLVLLLTSGFVAGTTASFSSGTSDTGNVFTTASLSPPGAQTVGLDGTLLDLSVASAGAIDGGGTVGTRWRYYYPTGISGFNLIAPTCATTMATYATNFGESSTTSLTGVAQPAFPGRWACVMSHTTYPTPAPAGPAVQWLSQSNNPVGAAQFGMVVQSMTLSNGSGTEGRMDRYDTIVVRFNQPVDPAVRPTTGIVCSRSSNEDIFIAPVDGGCSNSETAVRVAWLESSSAAGTTLSSNVAFATVTPWSWSADNRQVTITLNSAFVGSTVGGCSLAEATTTTGCWRVRTNITTTTGTALRSQNTPVAPLCTTDNATNDDGICWPVAYGRF